MKGLPLKQRCLMEEDGFTLPELLVTMLMLLTVMFALYGIFDMGIRVFSFGNDKVEAVENARIGLERMERELRAAYPIDVANGRTYLFFSAANAANTNTTTMAAPPSVLPSATSITFGNETNSAGTSANKIDCPTSPNCEYITYKLSGSGATRTLIRNSTSTGSLATGGGDQAVVEFVDGAGGLTFVPLESDGDPAMTEAQVGMIRIQLKIRVPGIQDGTQSLTTSVDLRNR